MDGGGRPGGVGRRGCGAGCARRARATGDCERRGVADGGARVPEVLTTAELEGFVAGFVSEPLEPAFGAAAVGMFTEQKRMHR